MRFQERDIEFEIAGIDFQDWPDFTDAYISGARFADTGEELTDSELSLLADCSSEQMNALVHAELASR